MALQTTTLQGILRGPDGVALAGATLRFVLSHTAADVGSNTALVRTPVDVVSGNDGSVSVDLWPNANGFENTHYDVRAYAKDENGKAITYEFGKLQVPDAGPADLAELLGEGVLRAQGVEGQVLDAAVRAETAAQSARASADEIDVASLEGRLEDRVDAFTAGAAGTFPVTPNLMKDTRHFDHLCGGQKGVAVDIATAMGGPWSFQRESADIVGTAMVVPYADFATHGIPTGGELAEMEGVEANDVVFDALLLDLTVPAGGFVAKISQNYPRVPARNFGEARNQVSFFAAVLEANGATRMTAVINFSSTVVPGAAVGQGWKHYSNVDLNGTQNSEFRIAFRDEGRIKLALALPYLGFGDHGGAKIWAGSVGFYHTEDQLLAGS